MLRSEAGKAVKAGYDAATVSTTLKPGKTCFCDYPSTKIKTALVAACPLSNPFDELVATAEVVFALIHHSEMNLDLKNAFGQLEKQFDMYMELIGE